MRNPILGMAFRDLCNAKTRILAEFPESMGIQMKDFHLPVHSRSVFSKIGVVPAPESLSPQAVKSG